MWIYMTGAMLVLGVKFVSMDMAGAMLVLGVSFVKTYDWGHAGVGS